MMCVYLRTESGSQPMPLRRGHTGRPADDAEDSDRNCRAQPGFDSRRSRSCLRVLGCGRDLHELDRDEIKYAMTRGRGNPPTGVVEL